MKKRTYTDQEHFYTNVMRLVVSIILVAIFFIVSRWFFRQGNILIPLLFFLHKITKNVNEKSLTKRCINI